MWIKHLNSDVTLISERFPQQTIHPAPSLPTPAPTCSRCRRVREAHAAYDIEQSRVRSKDWVERFSGYTGKDPMKQEIPPFLQ